ncbi:MAG: hypothetical protein HY986_03265 [Candidatus Melainabacteria bacterium]|nr:hypothetical protein [Candidatus Melainabacteria bacterium]
MENCCYLPIGGLLHLSGLVSAAQLRAVLGSRMSGERKFIGAIFVEKGLVSETELNYALSLQFLFKTGVLSAAHAVSTLRYIHEYGGSIVDAVTESDPAFAPVTFGKRQPDRRISFAAMSANLERSATTVNVPHLVPEAPVCTARSL